LDRPIEGKPSTTSRAFAIAAAAASARRARDASATTRWGFYLLSLKRYLQTGKGTPNPDDSEALG
jgi:hypothetical protein